MPLKSVVCQVRVVVARFFPAICSQVPGAAPALGWNPARLATPPSEITGLVLVTGELGVELKSGGAVVEPLERLEDAVGVRALMTGPVFATVSSTLPATVPVLIQMSPAAVL